MRSLDVRARIALPATAPARLDAAATAPPGPREHPTALVGGPADRLGGVLARTVAVRASTGAPLLQRLTEEDLEEIARKKPMKKLLDAARTSYYAQFGPGKPLASVAGVETWDFLVRKADDLEHLQQLVTDEIVKAGARKIVPRAKPVVAPPQPPSPPLVAVGVGVGSSASSSSSPSPSPLVSSPSSSSGPGLGAGKKKPKRKMVAAPDLLGSGAAHVQQTVPVVVALNNPQVQALIAGKPLGATRVMGPPQLSEDTVYFDLVITLPVDHIESYPRQRSHQLEVHYHPVPSSPNFLHIKMKAGGSPANQVAPANWLIDKAQLNQAVTDWNAAGRTPSTHAF